VLRAKYYIYTCFVVDRDVYEGDHARGLMCGMEIYIIGFFYLFVVFFLQLGFNKRAESY